MPLSIKQQDLDAYAMAVKGSLGDESPCSKTQLLLLLSALTEPAVLLLLAHESCHVRPLGAVNVRNRFELLRPDLCTIQSLKALEGALLTASCEDNARQVKRGWEIDLTVSLTLAEATTSSSVTAFRQVFTMLQFADVRIDAASKPAPDGQPPLLEWFEPFSLRIGATEPLLWARVCKDYNPIHINRTAALVFGFPGKIAHGNHLVAKAFEILNKHASRMHAVEAGHAREPLWMEVAFKRPVVVPALLQIETTQIGSGKETGSSTAFRILRNNKVSLEGRFGTFTASSPIDET